MPIKPALGGVVCQWGGSGGGGGGGGGGDAYAATQTTLLHMKRLNQTESPIFLCSLFPMAIPFDFYYIFLTLEITGLLWIIGK